MKKKNFSILRIPVVQTILASLLCILAGLLVGYLVLLVINPATAGDAILMVVKNFWNSNSAKMQTKKLAETLTNTAPLLMCSLSVLFAYKVGLFNIGAAGQYVAGVGASVYCAIALGWSWFPCMIMAVLAGAFVGSLSGILKAYRNVNEVISCIMLNWITLYLVNMLLTAVKNPAASDTYNVGTVLLADGSTIANEAAKLPSLGLNTLFENYNYIGLALPLSILLAIAVWVVLNKTKLGYELRATGLNKNAAKYCGMKDRFNIILTMAISGGLAGMGAALIYLTGKPIWTVSQTSVPSMGFNGIAAAFLGGLHPIGAIFSSYFIQHITDGGGKLTTLGCPPQISDFISSLIIYLCAFVFFFKTKLNKALSNKMSKLIAKKEGKA